MYVLYRKYYKKCDMKAHVSILFKNAYYKKESMFWIYA